MKDKIKIIYIDDNPMDKALVRDALEREHDDFVLTEASNKNEFENLLLENKFDLVLSDFNILGYEGLQVIDFIKSKFSHIPVIIVTGTGSEEIAVEAMKRSASDYIIKSPKHIKKLPESIKKTISANRALQVQNMLFRISNAVLNTNIVAEFIDIIKKELGNFIDTTNFFVAIYNKQTDSFELPFHIDSFDNVDTFPDSKTLSHYVVKTKKSVLLSLNEVVELEKRGEIELHGKPALSWMGVPLKIDEEIIGVMVIQSYVDQKAYSESDLELVESISASVSLEIKNKLSKQELIHLNNLLTKNNKELSDKITKIEQYTIELKKAKEKAEESEKLKTAFLQNISHEIRTPLNAISGFTGLLGKTNLSDEKRKNFISIIQNSSTQLISIVSDILTISSLETKQEKVSIEKVDVNNIVVDLLTIFKQQAQNSNIAIYTKQSLPSNEAIIYTDKTKLIQILNNLISNALKFTHEGFVEFGYVLKKNNLEFYVKDSGIGVKPEHKEKIFKNFCQADDSINRSYGGTGLGLAISKAFVELLGGEIWVESVFGKGSSFYFTIPYKKALKNNNSVIQENQNIDISKILVAEDEEFNYIFIEELLLDVPVKLIHAKDGLEVIKLVEENSDIDLILMDIKMPKMSGYEVAKNIKKTNVKLPIIAQTAYALEREVAQYRDVFDDYITKPINETEFKKILDKYLSGK